MNMATPRTDMARMNRLNMTDRDCFWWVQADFCAGIENELNYTKQLLAHKNETANTFMDQVRRLQSELAESREEFATLSKACGNWREFNRPTSR